jgi:hypothetical protein
MKLALTGDSSEPMATLFIELAIETEGGSEDMVERSDATFINC